PGTNRARRLIPIAQLEKERRPASELIHTFLLGIDLVRIRLGIWWQRREFVVTRPERKLVHDVLRLGNVNRRMSGSLDPLIGQIKGQLRSAIALVGNQENFGPELPLEVNAQLIDRFGEGSPAANSIRGIAVATPNPNVTDH